LTKWTKAQSSSTIEESDDLRYEAYASMINNALRKAWVRQEQIGLQMSFR
jgi:hypothetical protein